MKLLVFSMIAVAAFAAPQRYTLPEPKGPQFFIPKEKSTKDDGVAAVVIAPHIESSREDTVALREEVSAISTGFSNGPDLSTEDIVDDCAEGEIRHVDGSCVAPEISRRIFLFSVPKQQQPRADLIPDLPSPKVEHNILFVRLPEGGVGPEPIVVPPPRQENIIYVLSKQNEDKQQVIQVPAHPPSDPEIYFVNYAEGENPTLPLGIDLRTALGSAAAANGQVLGATGILDSRDVDGVSSGETFVAGGEFEGDILPGETRSHIDIGVSNIGTLPATGLAVANHGTGQATPSNIYSTP